MTSIPVVSPERMMFVVFDNVAECWIGQIIVEKHFAPACRLFSQLLADKSTQLAAHPNDYDLYFIGYVNDAGVIDGSERKIVMTGASWVVANSPKE